MTDDIHALIKRLRDHEHNGGCADCYGGELRHETVSALSALAAENERLKLPPDWLERRYPFTQAELEAERKRLYRRDPIWDDLEIVGKWLFSVLLCIAIAAWFVSS